MFKFRPVKYPRARVPVLTLTPADQQLNAYRVLDRNPARRELVIGDGVGAETYVSGQPVTGLEAQSPLTGGSGLALDTLNFGQPFGPPWLVLPGYVGELYMVTPNANVQTQLGELVDTDQQTRDNVIPTRILARPYMTGALPVQGAGNPLKVLEPDPDGLRRFIALYCTFGAVYLTPTPAPGDTRLMFQYGAPGGGVVTEPLVWAWPYIPRSGLFATGDAGGHRFFVVEGFGQ